MIEVVRYDERWPAIFDALKASIWPTFGLLSVISGCGRLKRTTWPCETTSLRNSMLRLNVVSLQRILTAAGLTQDEVASIYAANTRS